MVSGQAGDLAVRGARATIVSQFFSLSEAKCTLALFHDILQRVSFPHIFDLGPTIEISRFVVQIATGPTITNYIEYDHVV
jgi:hypothetical protein